MSERTQDTIAAIATPPGRGGVGIIRLSGPLVAEVARAVIGRLPKPRHAHLCNFLNHSGEVLDEGIALYFPKPHSFTGEDVLELHGHGGPVIMDLLLESLLQLGTRLARPGEFSERAFLNEKIDLLQAEAVADLIAADTAAAARLATRSLQGEFSQRIDALVQAVTKLRMYVEAAIDFPEEEIDFLADNQVHEDLLAIMQQLNAVQESARLGRLLRDGMYLVIAGQPNAGKSSLLNALAGRETSIVTEIPGTTRDLIREQIQLDGMPLHLIDTAGLREGIDVVEKEGIRRAREEISRADRILWVFDDNADPDHEALNRKRLPKDIPLTLVRNKIDLTGTSPGQPETEEGTEIALSLRTGEGLDMLKAHLKHCMGYEGKQEGEFIARRRHLDALARAQHSLSEARCALEEDAAAELVAEDLRQTQNALSEITGQYTSDDLLADIFASFCIGK